jgi:hypothetical protein
MASGFRRHRAVAVSVAAHLAVLAMIVFHNPMVIDLSPAGLAYGDGAHTYKLIYLPPGANDNTPADAAKLLFPTPASKPPTPISEVKDAKACARASAGNGRRGGRRPQFPRRISARHHD